VTSVTEGKQHNTAKWPASAIHDLRHRPASQLPALDGLRAAAILLVICDHWVYEWVTVSQHTSPLLAQLPMFYWGWTGVDLFFVLSGFLIGKQLWGELYATGSISVGSFVLRRGLRIWPLYYVTMLLFAVLAGPKSPTWPDWVMLSNYFQAGYGRSWSLSTEEQFYLLMPVLLIAFSRVVKVKWWPLCVVGLLVAVAFSRALTHAELSSRGLEAKTISTMMYSPFHLHCEPLLVGMLVAWARQRRPEWLQRAAPGRMAVRAIVASLMIAVCGIALRTANREVFAYLALGSLYGAALCVALTDNSILTAALRWKPWYFIARVSFGMYLNHLVLGEPTGWILSLADAVFPRDSTIGFLAGLLLTVLASALTAAVTFILVEQPGLAWRDRWLARRRAPRHTSGTLPTAA
jgi:peptidoglycan/LPS O-acetylase OafA/YrhL